MKTQFTKLAFTVAFWLALAFTFSCSSDDGDDGPGCTASNNTSTHYCSNGTLKQYGYVTDDGERTYKTVVIGTQTWMAENLNYNVSGSKCIDLDNLTAHGYPALSSDNTKACNTYGRLYDWATAMGIDAKYNEESWNGSDVKHRGVCPSGWHLPSYNEWEMLAAFVGGGYFIDTKLKATNGWAWHNGTDDYGFSALPGSFGMPGGGSFYEGNDGYWWSASEYEPSQAYMLGCPFEYAGWNYCAKIALFSVRCIRDYDDNLSSSSSNNPSIVPVYGTPVTDTRDGQTYQTVVIDKQTWMARNLNYNATNSKCYGDDTGGDSQGNCAKYGRLYDWETAKTVCPSGWHLPSEEEWEKLINSVGGSSIAGTKLKAKSGWNSNGNGTDNYGFAALPGGFGYLHSDPFRFGNVGSSGGWWSSYGIHGDYAYYECYQDMHYNIKYVYGYCDYGYLRSVRCLQD